MNIMEKLLCTCFITLIAAGLNPASPYTPTSASGTPLGDLSYSYNAMGQRTGNGLGYANGDQSLEWGLVGKPVKINTRQKQSPTSSKLVTNTETFAYGPGGQRYLRTHSDGSKTFYIGDMEYRMNKAGTLEERIVYIRNGGYSPVARVDTSSESPEYTYFLKDHLGSPLLAVDSEGAVVEAHSHGRHDPWGQPWSDSGTAGEFNENSRGFTGHENMASAGLTHMNGRVYDPMIGQFTGPDIFMQGASRMVGLNRYAYIGNSPVNGTDPSGWNATFGGFGQLGRSIFGKASKTVMEEASNIQELIAHYTTHPRGMKGKSLEDFYKMYNISDPSKLTSEEINELKNTLDHNGIIALSGLTFETLEDQAKYTQELVRKVDPANTFITSTYEFINSHANKYYHTDVLKI